MGDTTKTPFARATASRLVGAYVIDLLVLGALVGVTWFVYFTPVTVGLIIAEAVVASGVMLGVSGRTPGMALMRVCLIRDEDDAQTPSLGAAMGYTALSALLQVTVVGLLASYAMVHDGRTWLNGPTHTRFVDLRKHAALAAGPGQAVDDPRPGRAPSGFEGVQAGAGQWDAPSAPLTPVPPSVPDYAAPGQRANDPYSAPVAPSVPAVPAAPAAAQVPAAPLPSAPAAHEPTQFDALLAPPQGAPEAHRPAPQRPTPAQVPAQQPPAVPAPSASPAPQDGWGGPARQEPAQPQYAAPVRYQAPASGVPGPPPSRRDVQAAQRAAAQGQWGGAGQSQWGAPATPPRAQLLWLIFDSGQRELIDMPMTLGRAPAAVEGSRAVVVPDTTVSLSRTHMRVGPTASGAWIEDSFSANGTQIRTPDGRITALTGGQAVEVPAGTEILMGERRATIVHADADSVR